MKYLIIAALLLAGCCEPQPYVFDKPAEVIVEQDDCYFCDL